MMTRKSLSCRLKTPLLASALLCLLFAATLMFNPRSAQAFSCCGVCFAFDCGGGAAVILGHHVAGEWAIEEWIEEEFEEHREWMLETFFQEELGNAMARMTNQLSAVALQQALIAGAFLDAKHQLETQQLLETLKAQAHKDYQPSEDFCWFGTNARSLASSELLGKFNSVALSRRLMERHLGSPGSSGALGADEDMWSRWARFTNDHCDPKDNNWQGEDSGMELACGEDVPDDPNRVNRDIDFTRLIDEPRTINVNFTTGGLTADGEEEDVMAMANNLYGNKLLSRAVTQSMLIDNIQGQSAYLWLRSVAAQRSVAENSFSAIVGLKSSGTSDLPGDPEPARTREYMAAIMAELGIEDENGDGETADEIYALIGERPSYYAQLEILGKKIYQNPDFYANLYDKPANVERKATALKAVDLMLERAMYESQLRREMLLSVLLSAKLRKPFRDANQEMLALINE